MTYQVGGTHYETGAAMQHWDWVAAALNNDYHLGCATKYVYRYKNKNGLEDIDKTLTYVDKKDQLGGFEGWQEQEGALAATVNFMAGSPPLSAQQIDFLWAAVVGDAPRMRRALATIRLSLTQQL